MSKGEITHRNNAFANCNVDEMASFPYEPLPTACSTRLIRLQKICWENEWEQPVVCHLQTVDLAACPKYYALSYTWGDPRPRNEHDGGEENLAYLHSHFSISCDGHQFRVRKNLYEALQHLRRYSDMEYLWVDAICINQADDIERNAQVAIMGKIYASAHAAIVWLGNGDDKTQKAVGLIVTMGKALEKHWKAETSPFTRAGAHPPRFRDSIVFETFGVEPFTTEDYIAVMQLLRRAWFYRVWMIQEIALPVLKVFTVGFAMSGWAHLESFCMFFRWIEWSIGMHALAGVPIEEDSAFSAISRVQHLSPLHLAPHRQEKLDNMLNRLYGTGNDEFRIAAYAG